MYEDVVSFVDDFELLGPSADQFVDGFQERYGVYRAGCIENDPEQMQYEEMIDLGLSLGSTDDGL